MSKKAIKRCNAAMRERQNFMRNTGCAGVGIDTIGQLQDLARKVIHKPGDSDAVRYQAARDYKARLLRGMRLEDFP